MTLDRTSLNSVESQAFSNSSEADNIVTDINHGFNSASTKNDNKSNNRRPSATSRTQVVMGTNARRTSRSAVADNDCASTLSDLSSVDSAIGYGGGNKGQRNSFSLQKERTNESRLEKKLTHSNTLLSKITKTAFDNSKVVPPSKRRGILGSWSLIPEHVDSRDMPSNFRHAIVFIVAFCGMIGPMGTSILYPAEDNVIRDLDTTVTILNVAIGVYLITLGVVPLWWSNFSEMHGRRSIYVISFALYICFTIGCALSTSIHMLIGFRVLSGGCAASVQSVGAGTIGDLYPMTKRGAAMGLFYLGPLCGPLLSPIIGGAITSNKSFGWRATQWFLVILSGCCLLLIVFFLPETLRLQENRDAIRQILRDRRKQKSTKNATKDDIENQSTNLDVKIEEKSNGEIDSSTDTSKDELAGQTSPDSQHEFEPQDLNNQESENEDEELETMTRMLTRMSTNHSICEEEEAPVMGDLVHLSKVPTKQNEKLLKRRLTNAEDPEFIKKKMEKNLLTLETLKKGGVWAQLKYICKVYLYGPLKAFVFLRYPPVLLSIAYSAPCFAALYVCNMTLTYEYSRPPYNFGPMLVGLVYIPNSVTYFIASIWGGKFNDYLLKKKIAKYGVVAPEARFGINVYVAAALLPCALLITGWCLNYSEHWVTPLIGTALFGFAQMIVIGVTITYLADCLPGRGATGIALNNFIRMLMAAGVSFCTEPLIKAIGVGVLFSICAGICAVLSFLIVLIIRNGDRWREEYDLEHLYDLFES